jgi:glycosyltransferase involved in cell wall biosynthesis
MLLDASGDAGQWTLGSAVRYTSAERLYDRRRRGYDDPKSVLMNVPLVSVVIPAYNATATLDETLRSARSQTHRALEIIVVDDGSTDGTLNLAQQHAAADVRVQVVTQKNAGVAAARNNGWRRARSDLIAFLDADDLWGCTKIERQLQALRAGGPQVGLVYCWYVRIDGTGLVISAAEGPRHEGDVLDRLFVDNFVGNGSSPLVRRQALTDAHGFESGLRNAGAEGCEDLLFYCRVAEKYKFAVVPEHLIGYRYLPQNMSSDRPRMLRSWMLVVDEMLARHPQHRKQLIRGLRHYGGSLTRDAVLLGAHRQSLMMLRFLLAHGHPLSALRVARDAVRVLMQMPRRGRGRPAPLEPAPVMRQGGRRFQIGEVARTTHPDHVER